MTTRFACPLFTLCSDSGITSKSSQANCVADSGVGKSELQITSAALSEPVREANHERRPAMDKASSMMLEDGETGQPRLRGAMMENLSLTDRAVPCKRRCMTWFAEICRKQPLCRSAI